MIEYRERLIWAATFVALGAGVAGAQTPRPGAPAQTRAGAANSQPDLNGVWQALNTAAWNIEDHSAALGIPGGVGVVEGGKIPYLPWALAKRAENFASRETADPVNKCFMGGVPRATYMAFPFEIIQGKDTLVMSYEYANTQRIVHMDGSGHVDGAIDFWMGDSRGHWDGKTLVVDVAALNGENWLDAAGNFYSDTAHVVERYTPDGPNHLTYEATIEDPKVFARPWKISMPLYRRMEKNATLLDYPCYTFQILEKYKDLK